MDGVPDRLDEDPDDSQRSGNLLASDIESDAQFPLKFYSESNLGEKGMAAKNVLFMAIDDKHRAAWISRANDTDPPDYLVATSVDFELEEWPLPNPGDIPGCLQADPEQRELTRDRRWNGHSQEGGHPAATRRP
jgi:hypothetical protein